MTLIQTNIFRRLSRAGVLLCLSVLAACSHVREHQTNFPANWDENLQQKSAVHSWYVQGRLGVQTEESGGSLDVFWNQQYDNYQIRLIAPLGKGAYFISGGEHEVSLTDARGEEYISHDPDDLFAKSLGVRLPLTSLQQWLKGLPDKADTNLQWDDQGSLSRLEQDGWKVELARYSKVGMQMLPHAFYLTRDDQPELMVRLLLRSWQLDNLPDLK